MKGVDLPSRSFSHPSDPQTKGGNTGSRKIIQRNSPLISSYLGKTKTGNKRKNVKGARLGRCRMGTIRPGVLAEKGRNFGLREKKYIIFWTKIE